MSEAASMPSRPKLKPPYLLKVLRGSRRPKKTRVVAYRLDEATFETLQTFTAGASAAASRKVSLQNVFDAALSAYLATACPRAKVHSVDELADGDTIEVQAVAAE